MAHFLHFSEPAARLQRELEGVFDAFLSVPNIAVSSVRRNGQPRNPSSSASSSRRIEVPLSMWEGDDALRIELEVAGVEPQDIDVTIESNVLTIEGERKLLNQSCLTSAKENACAGSDEQKGAESIDNSKDESPRFNCLHSERKFGKFRRVIELPETVRTESIRADQRNGVLVITLQKQQRATPRKVPVSIQS